MNSPNANVEPNVLHESLCPPLPCIRSADLFGQQREIMIEHTGVYYRLCVTRANKLILMK